MECGICYFSKRGRIYLEIQKIKLFEKKAREGMNEE